MLAHSKNEGYEFSDSSLGIPEIPNNSSNHKKLAIKSSLKSLLDESEASKRQFIQNMEHDLRTPSLGIAGLADLLLEEETNADKKENLKLEIINTLY